MPASKWNEKGMMPVIILTVIALVSVLLLSLTANLTKDERDRQEALLKSENQRQLFPAANAFEDVDISELQADLPDILTAYLAKDNDAELGYIIEVSKNGYGGQLPVMTGIDNDGSVVGIVIGDNEETAGLGKKVEEEAYRNQFIGQRFDEPVGVDTIAAATISSSSVNASVRDALVAYGVLTGSGELPVQLDPKDQIFPDSTFEAIDVSDFENITEAWTVKDASGAESGTLFLSTTKGYGGDVQIFTGIDQDGLVAGVALGDNNETEGIGKQFENPEALAPYRGQDTSGEVKIDAMANVTVTTYAVFDGVDNAVAAYRQMAGVEAPVEPEGDDQKAIWFPGADFVALDVSQFAEQNITEAYRSEAGAVIGVNGEGFGGDMDILVGYETDGTIKGVTLGKNSETPGFGKAAEEPEYLDQYTGQNASDEITVDGVSGATVTSTAFINAVRSTADVFAVIDTLPEATDQPEAPTVEDDPKLELFPDATFEEVDAAKYADDGITAIYKTEEGYVIEAVTDGFGGDLHLAIGYTNDGEVTGLLIGENNETPGFGKAAEEAEYRDQYKGLLVDEIEVDGIAGATVTTHALEDGVAATVKVFKQLVGEEEEPVEDDPKLELFPDATFEEVDASDYKDDGITAIYKTEDGYVIEAVTDGFGGDLHFAIGYTNDGEVTGLLIGENNETPGFGKGAEEAEYRDQYKGLLVEEIEVDGIAGATVTTHALEDGVAATVRVFKQLVDEEEEPVEDDPKLELFPDATFEEVDASDYEDDGITAIYKTEDGYVIEAVTDGFGGDLHFAIGYTNDGEVTGLLIGENNETPGFGKAAEEAEYRDQYKGLKVGEIEVDGIAGATVTTHALEDGVAATVKVFKQLVGEEEPVEDDPKLELFPDATFEEVDASDYKDDGITAIYKTEDGYVIEAVTDGFGGDLHFAIGYTNDGEVTGLLIGENNETPGFGKAAEEAEYRDQYKGLLVDEIEVDGVAGATVTTHALEDGVAATVRVFKQLIGEEVDEPVEPERPVTRPALKRTLRYGVYLIEQTLPEDVAAAGDVKIYTVKNGAGGPVGTIYQVEVKGHGKTPLVLNLGVDLNGLLTGFTVESSSETEGIGSRVLAQSVIDTLLTPAKPIDETIEVDAISGATETRTAVNHALARVKELITGEVTVIEDVDTDADASATTVAAEEGSIKDVTSRAAYFIQHVVTPETVDAIYTAKNGAGGLVARIYEVTVAGFGGDLTLYIGIDPHGEIIGIAVKTTSETEGIGSRALSAEHLAAYIGQNVNETVEVDDVSSATVTSKAVALAVEIASEAWLDVE